MKEKVKKLKRRSESKFDYYYISIYIKNVWVRKFMTLSIKNVGLDSVTIKNFSRSQLSWTKVESVNRPQNNNICCEYWTNSLSDFTEKGFYLLVKENQNKSFNQFHPQLEGNLTLFCSFWSSERMSQVLYFPCNLWVRLHFINI